MAVNETYSHKSLSDQNFTAVDPTEFNNSEIVGSSFHQWNAPHSDVFPAGMTGVTFVRCNLDNCNIPPGNTLDAFTCNKHYKVVDGVDMLVDDNDDPVDTMEHVSKIGFWMR